MRSLLGPRQKYTCNSVQLALKSCDRPATFERLLINLEHFLSAIFIFHVTYTWRDVTWHDVTRTAWHDVAWHDVTSQPTTRDGTHMGPTPCTLWVPHGNPMWVPHENVRGAHMGPTWESNHMGPIWAPSGHPVGPTWDPCGSHMLYRMVPCGTHVWPSQWVPPGIRVGPIRTSIWVPMNIHMGLIWVREFRVRKILDCMHFNYGTMQGTEIQSVW